MLAQAVCSMTVCQNSAAGVNCMWASSYDGELSSWVIDESCAVSCSSFIFHSRHNVCIGLKTICRAQYLGRLHLFRNMEILWSSLSAQVQFQRTSRRTLHVTCNSSHSQPIHWQWIAERRPFHLLFKSLAVTCGHWPLWRMRPLAFCKCHTRLS